MAFPGIIEIIAEKYSKDFPLYIYKYRNIHNIYNINMNVSLCCGITGIMFLIKQMLFTNLIKHGKRTLCVLHCWLLSGFLKVNIGNFRKAAVIASKKWYNHFVRMKWLLYLRTVSICCIARSVATGCAYSCKTDLYSSGKVMHVFVIWRNGVHSVLLSPKKALTNCFYAKLELWCVVLF